MITDQLTNAIYFSDKLQTECKEVYETIMALKEKGLPIELFSGAKSMWARDYMPIQVSPDRFIAFKYSPDYLNDTKEHMETITKNAADICRNIVGKWAEVEESDIILDGGNVIKCDDAVIMVDKILRENPQYSSSALLRKLEQLFGCEVYLIPWDAYEGIYGHSDGILRYIGNNELLYTKYDDNEYIKDVKHALDCHFPKSHTLWMPSSAAKCRKKYQWAYINYIRTMDYIILPALSPKADCEEDKVVHRQFELRFPEYPKDNIIQVYALDALKNEGGLHCCSWNIFRQIK